MRRFILVLSLLLFTAGSAHAQASPPPLQLFLEAASHDDRVARRAMDQIAEVWTDSYTSMVIDLARLMRRAAPTDGSVELAPSPFEFDESGRGDLDRSREFGPTRPIPRQAQVRARLLRFLERHTRKRFDEALQGWRQWMWSLPYDPHPQYGEFKGIVYSQIDERMRRFFPPRVPATIRLDEIDWGGVVVNGIPPLVYPKVLRANEARYLADGNIVFGIVVNGEARAYPKRILAWHELATDRVGGVELTVVYCTLCGTVLPYESTVGGRVRRFGTSGLLYRSNKLMFDEETASLWSALEGTPVVGSLVGSGLTLTPREVVTTTWGEWRALHPATTVLSTNTGHRRDYAEGAAYRDYFATDTLYFGVAHVDRRLRNKTEVLTLRVRRSVGPEAVPVAIEAGFLRRNPVFPFEAGGRRFVAVTSRHGANRVYELRSNSVVLQPGRTEMMLSDTERRSWRVTEEALVLESNPDVRLARVPAARAFWFGWYAQFPETILIK